MAKSKIQPLGDRVLVKQAEEKEQIKGGIIIPTRQKKSPKKRRLSQSEAANLTQTANAFLLK